MQVAVRPISLASVGRAVLKQRSMSGDIGGTENRTPLDKADRESDSVEGVSLGGTVGAPGLHRWYHETYENLVLVVFAAQCQLEKIWKTCEVVVFGAGKWGVCHERRYKVVGHGQGTAGVPRVVHKEREEPGGV